LRKNYASQNTRTLFNLYEIYDNHRQSILWFLEEFDADSYEEYTEKYAGASSGRSNFIAVCGFFELSGVLVSHKMIDQNLYFDMFNPAPFWQKARFVIEGMRHKRPHIYENFESLTNMRLSWTQLRTKKHRKKFTQKRQI
jgi:hypothetical protein